MIEFGDVGARAARISPASEVDGKRGCAIGRDALVLFLLTYTCISPVSEGLVCLSRALHLASERSCWPARLRKGSRCSAVAFCKHACASRQ